MTSTTTLKISGAQSARIGYYLVAAGCSPGLVEKAMASFDFAAVLIDAGCSPRLVREAIAFA